jgi:hypothetical protein
MGLFLENQAQSTHLNSNQGTLSRDKATPRATESQVVVRKRSYLLQQVLMSRIRICEGSLPDSVKLNDELVDTSYACKCSVETFPNSSKSERMDLLGFDDPVDQALLIKHRANLRLNSQLGR